MENLDFIKELPVFEVLVIVVLAILVDAIFGALKATVAGEFDWKELPRFLGTNVLPYGLGLLVLAVVAEYQGEPFSYIFYPVALAVLIRYVAKIKKKIQTFFDIEWDLEED